VDSNHTIRKDQLKFWVRAQAHATVRSSWGRWEGDAALQTGRVTRADKLIHCLGIHDHAMEGNLWYDSMILCMWQLSNSLLFCGIFAAIHRVVLVCVMNYILYC